MPTPKALGRPGEYVGGGYAAFVVGRERSTLFAEKVNTHPDRAGVGGRRLIFL